MERSKAGSKGKMSPVGLSQPNQNIIIINIIWYYFTRIVPYVLVPIITIIISKLVTRYALH